MESLPRSRWRLVRWIIAISFIFVLLLGLDLANQGLAWRLFWSQTGEEQPLGQLQGMLELGSNLLRAQPDTQPMQPIQYADDIPYGINTFLQKEVEEPKLRVMLQMIQEAGFVWLRQEFPWEDLEVDGRGQFTDTRNDRNGDGEINAADTIDAWAKYDQIVDLVDEYGLKMMVRLSNPPGWSRADNENTTPQAPPDDYQDFVNYAVAVAERYKGQIQHYQVWNEPNIYPEWGNDFADAVAYTDMLCRTYDALKAVDPDIVVISAAIAPTISLDGFYGYQDVIYLQNMYDAGAGDCFDVLAAQGYGLRSGPTDRRLSITQVNYQRHVYYRDMMVANGDAHKPIWLSEMAWNAILDAELPADQITQYGEYGQNTQDEAARWTPLAYQRAAEEWPWIGQIDYWFFTRPDPFEADQAFYYFRMVEPDYSPEEPTFTPLPVYGSMRDYIAGMTAHPVLYRGVHQAESWEITTEGELPDPTLGVKEAVEGAQFGEAISTRIVTFTSFGTDTHIRVKAANGVVSVYRDGSDTPVDIPPSDDWQDVTLDYSILPEEHSFRVTTLRNNFLLDSVTVDNRVWWNLLPFVFMGVGLVTMLAAIGYWAWQRRRYRRR
ncbi:MAG: cellulase family glycosylhydrolase [Anaerolineae bacterium]|nr:cellulase family glycosylhydrolase [Anaerolineae bacterium]